MKTILGALVDFNLSSEPQLDLARWRVNRGIDLGYALNVAGSIVEHDVVIFPHMLFDFAEPGNADAIRAVVQVAFDEGKQ